MSRTVSLDSDADRDTMAASEPRNDFEDQMQDLDTKEFVDRKIIAATNVGVDIPEVCSPERVAKVAKRFGLVAVLAMDLTTGFDLEADRQLVWKRVKKESAFVLIGSSPCTRFSMLQELSRATNEQNPGWMQNFEAERGRKPSSM